MKLSQLIISKMQTRTRELSSTVSAHRAETVPLEPTPERTFVKRTVAQRESMRRVHQTGFTDPKWVNRLAEQGLRMFYMGKGRPGAKRPKYKFHRRGTGRIRTRR